MADNFAYLTNSSPGAPSLSGTAGDLIAVLDYVLDVANTTNGWEKVFSGTNKAVYRPRTGNRMFFRVLDDGSVATAGAREAVVRGYESMSDVDTGVDPFPTVLQAAEPVWKKAFTISSTARTWRAIRTSRYMILAVRWYDTVDSASATLSYTYVMGDVPSTLASDPWNTVLTAHTTGNSTANDSFFGSDGETQGLSYRSTSPGSVYGVAVRTSTGAEKSRRLRWASSAGGSRQVASYSAWTTGEFRYYPIYMVDSYNETADTTTAGFPRLRIPNFHVTSYFANTTGGLLIGDTVQDGERQFVVVGDDDGYGGAFRLLEITDTDGAL